MDKNKLIKCIKLIEKITNKKVMLETIIKNTINPNNFNKKIITRLAGCDIDKRLRLGIEVDLQNNTTYYFVKNIDTNEDFTYDFTEEGKNKAFSQYNKWLMY